MIESGPELPVHLTPFIGRDRELDDLVRLTASARLLTLTGAGGSGKSRLAREAAARVAGEGPGAAAGDAPRVVWTDLSSITQPELVAQQVARALQLPERADASARQQIAAAFGREPVLLVLDNCEHIVEACAELAEHLLRACPGLRILATSREALGVSSETAWLTPPMAGDEALALFADRARATLPSFRVTEANAGAVAEVCRRLDRIPLAIELAAARVRVLSPEQIAQRLDHAFQLLSAGSRTAVPRHRTLRATMEWSYGLLDAREQALLGRLAVFAGSFTLEAAEAVCAGDPLDVDGILDGVAALVDKSLVVMDAGDGLARYRLLETVRQYAAERLAETEERARVEERFAHHFLTLAEDSEPSLIGGSSAPDVLARLSAETDNLRAATAWATADPARAPLGLRFVSALYWFWYAVGAYREARQQTDRALAVAGDAAPALRGRALVTSALIALGQGEYERSIAGFGEALPLLGPAAAASTGSALGAAKLLAGDVEGAIYTLDEALALTADHGDDHPAAILARFWRAWAAYAQDDLEMAHALTATNERVGRQHALPTTHGHALATLARIELKSGRVERACELATEALDIEVAIGDRWGIAFALDVVAMLAARRGHPETAARLLGGIQGHRERVAVALPGLAPAERADLVVELRAALGSRFVELYEEGLGLSTADTVRLVAEEADALPAPSPRPEPAVAAGPPPPAEPVRPRLHVQALGPLQVAVDDRVIDASAWGSARPRELLVYLLMHPGGRTKEQVGLAFWPDASSAQLRNNFHVTLHRLRKALGGADWVGLEHDRYAIDPARASVDALTLEAEVADARRALKRKAEGAAARLEQALAPYRGDFLDGEPVGDWSLEHRDRLQRIYLDALMELGAHHAGEGRHPEAAEAYRRILARDELHEEAVRALMRALAEGGERSHALRAYQRFADRLERELEAEPEEETVELMEELKEG